MLQHSLKTDERQRCRGASRLVQKPLPKLFDVRIACIQSARHRDIGYCITDFSLPP